MIEHEQAHRALLVKGTKGMLTIANFKDFAAARVWTETSVVKDDGTPAGAGYLYYDEGVLLGAIAKTESGYEIAEWCGGPMKTTLLEKAERALYDDMVAEFAGLDGDLVVRD